MANDDFISCILKSGAAPRVDGLHDHRQCVFLNSDIFIYSYC